MKKYMAFLLTLALLVSLSACGKKKEEPEEERIVRIGIFEPLTGRDSAYGEAEKLGIEYAHSLAPTVKVRGKEYAVELVVKDNAGSTTFAADAAQELVDAGVAVVLGSYGDAVSMAGGPVFEKAGVAAIGVTCTAEGITADNDYYFRVCSRENVQSAALGNYAFGRLGARVAYVMGVMGDPVSAMETEAFTRAFEAQGGRVIFDQLPAEDADLVLYLNRGYSEGAGLIFAPLPPESIARLVSLSRSLKINLPLLGTDVLDDDSLLEIPVDEEYDGAEIRIYVSTFYAAGGSESFDAGLRAYVGYDPEEALIMGEDPGEDPVSAAAALGYDAYNLALEAITAAGSVDKADILAIMPKVIHTGITGKLSFADNGDVIRETVYIKRADYVDGEWRLDRKQSATY